jgi:hypothetical protein
MATKETRTTQLPLASSLINTDKVVVIKAGITSIADVSTVTAAAFLGKSTDSLPEGGNLYFTNSRVKSKVFQMIQAGTGVSFTINDLAETITISALGDVRSVNTKTGFVSLNTDDIPEGTTNKYITNTRIDTRVADLLKAGANVTLNYNPGLGTLTINSTGNVRSVNTLTGDVILTTDTITQGVSNFYYTETKFDASLVTKTTTNLAEGTNQYFTPARVRTTVLTGFSSGADVQVEGTDNLLQGLGKLQSQIISAKGTTNAHIANTSNPHNVTKAQVGLDNVPNINTTVASNIASGILSDSRLSSNVTLQGNTFNGVNQLLKLDALGKLPAIDGSQLTGLISQIANLSDVQLTSLQTGQTLSYNGTKWVNVTSEGTALHDYVEPYSYVGRAAQSSLEGSNVWKITRIQNLTDANVLITTALNVSWTNRYTHTYS